MLGQPKPTPAQLARREVERLHRAEVDLSDELLGHLAKRPQVVADTGRALLDAHLEARTDGRHALAGDA